MFGSYLDFLKSNFTAEEAIGELETANREGLPVAGLARLVPHRFDRPFRRGRQERRPRGKEERSLLSSQHSKFDPALHSNYVTVQLARWVAEHRKRPDEAKELYDFIIEKRPGTANYNYALVDTAELLAKSKKPEDRAEALTRFERVLREVPDEELRELAVLGTARIYTAGQEIRRSPTLLGTIPRQSRMDREPTGSQL